MRKTWQVTRPRPCRRSLSRAKISPGSLGELKGSADGGHDQRGQHAGSQAFARHISHDDPCASIASSVGKSLERKSPPHFAGGGEIDTLLMASPGVHGASYSFSGIKYCWISRAEAISPASSAHVPGRSAADREEAAPIRRMMTQRVTNNSALTRKE